MKTTNASVRLADIPPEIRKYHFPNMSQGHYLTLESLDIYSVVK
jgi:hypothetical protein